MFVRFIAWIVIPCPVLTGGLEAQVAIHPTAIVPAAWERIALRVVNQTDTATVVVRLSLPDVISVLGIDETSGWSSELIPATDSTPQVIEWSGGSLERGSFREFAFLGRLAGDARRRELTFPVSLTRANGSVVEWHRTRGTGVPPSMRIVAASSDVTGWGTLSLAGAAVGIAVLALALALSRRRREEGGGRREEYRS